MTIAELGTVVVGLILIQVVGAVVLFAIDFLRSCCARALQRLE